MKWRSSERHSRTHSWPIRSCTGRYRTDPDGIRAFGMRAFGMRAFGMRLSRASRTQAFFEREHLREPHYYVRYVGVATGFQGRRLVTALLRPTLDRCDREGLPAYLEASSDRSAALYEPLGLVHLGELRLPGGPPFWPMRRPPDRGS
jgi:RimJ/RimL family protein N-acetyltransferase